MDIPFEINVPLFIIVVVAFLSLTVLKPYIRFVLFV